MRENIFRITEIQDDAALELNIINVTCIFLTSYTMFFIQTRHDFIYPQSPTNTKMDGWNSHLS